jgi:5'-3' exonuclease
MSDEKKKLAIIDADAFLFYAGWAHKNNLTKFGSFAVKEKVDQMIRAVLRSVKADYYLGFYGVKSSSTFRHSFATERPYKGSRTSEEWQEYFKPIIKQHYSDQWGFHGMEKLEADDAVVIAYNQYKEDYDVVMIGEDKDMHQIGEFFWYNPKNNTSRFLTHEEGRKFYWCQHIEGDSADAIAGVKGQGKKSPIKDLINNLDPFTEEAAFNIVRDAHIQAYGENYLYHLLENNVLLTMMTTPKFDYPTDIKLTSVVKEKESILKRLNI